MKYLTLLTICLLIVNFLSAQQQFTVPEVTPEQKQEILYNHVVGYAITGIGFAIGNVKPIPAIILAQALNGFLLPFVSIFLFIVINSREITKNKTNPFILNVLMIFVIFITLILGLNSATKAFFSVLFTEQLTGNQLLFVLSIISATISIFIWMKAKPNAKS